MVSGAMCRRFESFQARFLSPAQTGECWDLPFGSLFHYGYPYSNREGKPCGKEGKRGGFGLPSQGRVVGGTVQDPDPRRT